MKIINRIPTTFIKERYPFYDEDLATRDVELNGEQVQELMQSYSDQQNAELLEKIANLENSYTKFAKERDEQYGEYIDLNVGLRNENAELRERVSALTHQRDFYRKKLNEAQGVSIAKDLGIPDDFEMAPIVQSDTDELRERVKELEAALRVTRNEIDLPDHIEEIINKALKK